jgi:Uncharacterized protein conserved in bacteria (DUF2330)
MRASLVLLLGLAAVACLPTPPATGCAIPWRHGESVTVDSEDAIIVWDEATKTEHFIRRANFRTDAKEFGFLVPTPTRPELAEANDALFAALADATKPRVVYQKVKEKIYRNEKKAMAGAAPMAMAPEAPRVQVLETKKVAGFDAAVLKANDPKALRDWLDKNGYDARKELVEWFQWYTDHEWIITAFKLSKDGSIGNQVKGRTVRMTFKAEKPFYPYREPADMRKAPVAGQRMLKVYFLADKRYAGTLGEKGPWPGQPVWANATPAHTIATAFANLGLEPKAKDAAVAKKWHLTEFEDKSFPRPGTDEVYFRPAADQGTLERPPVVVPVYEYEYVDGPAPGTPGTLAAEGYAFPILLGVLAVVVGVICLLGWLLTRK